MTKQYYDLIQKLVDDYLNDGWDKVDEDFKKEEEYWDSLDTDDDWYIELMSGKIKRIR